MYVLVLVIVVHTTKLVRINSGGAFLFLQTFVFTNYFFSFKPNFKCIVKGALPDLFKGGVL